MLDTESVLLSDLRRNTVFRWSAVYIGLFSVSILFILGFIYWQTGGHLAHLTDTIISGDLVDLANEYDSGKTKQLVSTIAGRSDYGDNRIYLLADSGFNPIAGNLDEWPKVKPDAGGWVDFELPCTDPAKCVPDGPRHLRAKVSDLAGGLHLLAGRDVDDTDDIQEDFRHALGWGLGLIIAVGIAGGVILSLAVMRRLDAISRTSGEIMRGDLSKRVPVRGVGDDFDELACNLNAMLARIQGLMATVKGVSDNIAHDLRTPLARLRARLELARTADPSTDQAWIDGTIANLDSVLDTFEALLKIGEVEASSPQQCFTTINLAEIVEDASDFYEPLAEEKQQQLELQIQPVPLIMGERDLLFRALGNLLDNAIKYAPEGSRIEISLQATGSGAKLAVADHGPGIPEQSRSKVFERFFRLDTSRSLPGNGLGLSLVLAVAVLHGTSVHLEDNGPGLRVTMEFLSCQPSLEPRAARSRRTPAASLRNSAV